MEIVFSPEMIAYKEKKGFTELTVDDIATRGACCKILVPKVTIGSPQKKTKTYTQIEAYGVLIHMSTKLNFDEVVTFTYGKLLMREMIECHGYEIQRSASIF